MNWKHAANWKAYALGKRRSNGFDVRRVVWGRLMAEMECREDEEIIPAKIQIKK